MADLEIRPTLRYVYVAYVIAAAVLLAAVSWSMSHKQQQMAGLAALAGAGLLILWPVSRHVQRQRIRCRIDGNQLRYEEGLFSTSVKTIPIAGIQDVTVDRSFSQRLWGVGNIRIETAGKGSVLYINNVENAQQVTDRILGAVKPKV